MNGSQVTYLVLGLLAPMGTGCEHHQPTTSRSPPSSAMASILPKAPETKSSLPTEAAASQPVPKRLTEVLELPQQVLKFKPSRDDISVGHAIFSFKHTLLKETNLDAIEINGMRPDTDVLHLKQLRKNEFELPAMKIEFSSQELGGPLYLSIKVYFNELTNQYDSQFYENVPDRYAIISYCTKEDEVPSEVNARLGANRAVTFRAFTEALAKPLTIKLNQQSLLAEWGRYPMLPPAGRLDAAEVKAIEQAVRDKNEKYLISISVSDADHARVFVGEGTYFRSARVYSVVRSEGAWRVENIKDFVD